MDANQALFDAALRHQVAVRRYSATLLKRMVRLLEEADRDLVEHLRTKLARAVGATDGTARLEVLITEVRAMREAIGANLEALARGELTDFASLEADWEQAIITSAVPVELVLAAPALDTLRAVVESKPFQGRFLKDWFSSQRRGDQERLEQALRLGMANGETLDDIVRRVVGTRANKYADGILAINRRNAEAVVRTAVTHVSTAARGAVWAANEDIIWALRWTATLDGRTSPVCQSRDGDLAMVGDNRIPAGAQALSPKDARPPAHVNCRSTMVAVLSPDGVLGDRPFVRDARTRPAREVDFRAEAKAKAGDGWRSMSEAERRAAAGRVRSAWASENIGQVPAATTYAEWMGRQPMAFQDEVLGPTRAAAFRSGSVKLDDFVDRSGRELTIKELRERFPTAFETGGVS
jgi:SPP1 gp7 family putative phage head morphogenesis protein